MSGHRRIVNLVFFLVFAAVSVPVGAQEAPPRAIVERFQDELLEVMKAAANLGVRGRYERLEPLIRVTYHLPLMIRIATDPYWNTATRDQKSRLVGAFRRMSVSTLATLFDGYSGQIFRTVGEKPGTQGTRLVETELVNTDGSTVDIAYIAKKSKNGWRIVDVIVDNDISELKVRQSEYRRVLQDNGIEGLIAILNKKAAELIDQ